MKLISFRSVVGDDAPPVSPPSSENKKNLVALGAAVLGLYAANVVTRQVMKSRKERDAEVAGVKKAIGGFRDVVRRGRRPVLYDQFGRRI